MSDLTHGRVASCVPPSELPPLDNPGAYLLLWVAAGRTTVDVEGTSHTLTASDGLWVPPGMSHSMMTAPGALVLPYLFADSPALDAFTEVTPITVPVEHRVWMVNLFARGLGYLESEQWNAGEVLALMLDALRRTTLDPLGTTPRPPTSPAAARVAATLLDNPTDPRTAAEHAADVAVGTRTLQRQFAQESGLGFSTWRLRLRLAVAARHLAAGRSVAWSADAAGFIDAGTFSRAFRQHTGTSPREYARARPQAAPRLRAAARDTSVHADRTWPRINAFDIVVWMYRGTATVHLGARTLRLGPGEALLLPAGVPNQLDVAAGGVCLPISQAPTGCTVRPDEVDVVRLSDGSEEADIAVLHQMIASYTLIRPRIFDQAALVRGFRQRAKAASGCGEASDHVTTERVSGVGDAAARDVHGGSAGVTDFGMAGSDSVVAGDTGAGVADCGDAVSGSTGSGASAPWRPATLEEVAIADQEWAHIQHVTQALTARPADQRSLADWARVLGCSTAELSRAFARHTGQTFPRWRGLLRMTLAREMLREGYLPGEVSRRLGYAHASGFTLVFSTAHDMSPRAFQRQVRGTPPSVS